MAPDATACGYNDDERTLVGHQVDQCQHTDDKGQSQQEAHDHDEAEPAVRDAIASIFAALNETPVRSPMVQVLAVRSITLTGVNSPSPLGSPATLTVIESRAPPPTAKRWTRKTRFPSASAIGAFVS